MVYCLFLHTKIVGYVTYQLKGGAQEVRGVPFLTTGTTSFSLQDITLSNGTDGADTVMFWDPATRTWETIQHWNEAYESLESEESIGEGWGDGEGTIINKTMTPGTAFWISTINDTTVTIPGQVCAASDASKLTTVGGAQDLLAGVFPVALNIQDISLDNGTDGADTIMLWNADRTWTTIQHWNEAYETLESEESIGEGWGDGEGTLIQKTLDPAQGFWISTINDCTITFKSPL